VEDIAMNRIDRLTGMILLLQGQRVITAEQIAGNFEISVRTVYRDMSLIPASMESCKMSMFPSDPEQGVGGALITMDGFEPGPGGTLVYLNVDGDLDGVLSRIPAAGGTVLKERMDIAPHRFIAIFRDPEGNVVGLHRMS
jgi:uncharacterized protein